MSFSNPYHRLWRPVKGYKWVNKIVNDNNSYPSMDFLCDDRFICQSEIKSLVVTAHLIIRDLYEIFNYIEPNDANIKTYSHRIYELFLRTATEFESNCKSILRDNGYAKAEKDMNILDYFKIAVFGKLSEYRVTFKRWTSQHEFRPFETWNMATYFSLPWYQDYNQVKHNRYANFHLANLGNLMSAISGLLCILHVQYGEEMGCACFEGISVNQTLQEQINTDTFTIILPNFPDSEKYDFIWNDIKGDANPVQNYTF